MEEHDNFVWKSLIVLLGIYAFFITERLTILFQNSASNRKQKRNQVRFSVAHSGDQPSLLGPPKGIAFSNGGMQAPPQLPTNEQLSPKRGDNPQSTVITSVGGTTNSNVQTSVCPKQSGQEEGRPTPTRHSTTESYIDIGQECQSKSASAGNVCSSDASLNGNLCYDGTNLGAEGLTSDNQLCNKPPSRPLDNARCAEFLTSDVCNGSDASEPENRREVNACNASTALGKNGFIMQSWNVRDTNSNGINNSEADNGGGSAGQPNGKSSRNGSLSELVSISVAWSTI
ncbi:unnamed protein product [Dibothriocephalus latus]|uniref:Uncharacterized protein n=1 Tax=Dibothriocephalus latus TaxID=60516 RepID=A0A3P7LBS7_DIBLA|nr:unnamed protein product [Dibothriocephalus latus]